MSQLTSSPSIHDRVDRLVDDVAAIYDSLSGEYVDRGVRTLCSEPAAAWVADAAVRGRTLPVNEATVAALVGAAAALRVAARRQLDASAGSTSEALG